MELGVFGKYVDPRKTRLHPVSFIRTGANTKMIQQLTEFGQNLRSTGPNELAIANVVALVITELQQKPAPEAYMGYALYDADSVLYEQGKIVLSKKARNKHEELIQKLAIKKDGYIETFLVNETSENVWFDQFRIESTGPLIVQETHYDPWGVELSGLGYQYGGIKVNPYLYNGKEANGHLGVNLFDYGARMYDPAIGRWFVVDPLSNHELQIDKSPYAYGWNNPIRYRDPNGMCPNGCSEGEKTGDIYAEGAVVQNKYGASQLKDGKWVKISHTPMTGNSSDGIRINGMFGGGGSGQGSTSEGSAMRAGVGEYKDGLNVASYLAGTSTTVNELYRGNEFSKAYKTDSRRVLNRAFPGRFKGLSTNTLNKLTDYRVAKAIAKGFSKPLLGVGIVLTAVDIHQNDYSASSIAWGAADTGIAIAAIAVSGPAAPLVAVGAALYFTGRFAYGVYEAYNEGN